MQGSPLSVAICFLGMVPGFQSKAFSNALSTLCCQPTAFEMPSRRLRLKATVVSDGNPSMVEAAGSGCQTNSNSDYGKYDWSHIGKTSGRNWSYWGAQCNGRCTQRGQQQQWLNKNQVEESVCGKNQRLTFYL